MRRAPPFLVTLASFMMTMLVLLMVGAANLDSVEAPVTVSNDILISGDMPDVAIRETRVSADLTNKYMDTETIGAMSPWKEVASAPGGLEPWRATTSVRYPLRT